MRTLPAKGRSVYLTARLTYRTSPDAFFGEAPQVLHRVHYGMWLGEDYNSVSLNLTDTRELVLTISFGGKCVAVRDNRHSVSKHDEPSYFEIPEELKSFLVDVALLDEQLGQLDSFTFEITTNPLGVHPIILV